MRNHPFDRCGLASLGDLQTPEWRSLFTELESVQKEFLGLHPHSAKYTWPRDPLHTWSRVWEYPYVYYHLRKLHEGTCSGGTMPVVVDFGSGVTFLPFVIGRRGFEVVCVDQDPLYEQDIQRAAMRLQPAGDHVRFSLSRGNSLPLPDHSVNVVYSVSVLEHIPEHAAIVAEFARVLIPGGVLLLTIDINLEPYGGGIGPAKYASLLLNLHQYFDFEYPRLPIHPAAVLTSARGPYAVRRPSGVKAIWWVAKQKLIKPLIGRAPAAHLACEGLMLRRRNGFL